MHCLLETRALPDLLATESDRIYPGLLAQLPADDALQAFVSANTDRLKQVLAVSPFITGQLTVKPQLWIDWAALLDQPFDRDRLRTEVEAYFSDIQAEPELLTRLRRFRILHTMAIAWRDLSGAAELDETLAYLSELSDRLINVCLDWYYRQLSEVHGAPTDANGQPMPLVVLAMGKLGAQELNFSSDIDLILAYESDGQTVGKRALSHHDFFIRLAQKLSQGLGKMTEDGFVYRVDLRLRPYGDSGPLAMGFAAMEEYYQTQGREWERYAMIKARPVGMDIEAGQVLLDILKPFVYRKYLDYGVVQSLRELKGMINREVIRKDRVDHLKLGPGGIREIEFIAQVFQLTRGGRDTSLQARPVQLILSRLTEKNYLTPEEGEGLIAAYRFLRQAENHIQELYDRQEHALPKNALDQARLAISMGYSDYGAFLAALGQHRGLVQQCFEQVFEIPETSDADTPRAVWLEDTDAEVAQGILSDLGFRDGPSIHERLQTIRHQGVYKRLSRQGQERFDCLIPELITLSSQHDDADEVLKRLLAIVTAIARRESYLALLVEQPAAQEQLAKLCGESPWITEVITQHPILLDELIDPRRLYTPPDRQTLNIELTTLLADLEEGDVEMQMERLRTFKQVQQLRIAAADIMGAMPLMVVSDHLTWLAESLVNVALEFAWQTMMDRYGVPGYEEHGVHHEAQFAVIAYGKMGGIELGYGSDLDILFVHDSHGQSQNTDGERSVENLVFFTRLAQRFVHLLATLTPSGILYEIDTRLRPNGQSGMLVTSVDALEDYQRNEAWTWEHQALVRARPVAGGQEVMTQFEAVRGNILRLPRDDDELREAVLEMRQKMRSELDQSTETLFDLKQGVGGIVDIEFMVQYLVLRWASDNERFLQFTDVIRLLEIASDVGRLAQEKSTALIEAYRVYRNFLHHRVLQGKGRCVEQDRFADHQQQVVKVWQELLDR